VEPVTRPPFRYYGGKTQLAGRIAALLPEHGHYVEPFAGSLSVLLAKPRVKWETVNDLDGELVTFWRVLRDQPEELARVCELTPYSRAEYQAANDRDGIDDLERARRVWVRLTQGRARTLDPAPGWCYGVKPRTGTGTPASDSANHARRIPLVAERLVGVHLECRPALDIIARYGADPGVLIYADPPYLGDTRGENGRERYRVDMTGIGDHRELAGALNACAASVVLSGYDSPVYAELYDGWHVTRFEGRRANGGGERTEVLWSNRPLVEPTLFDEVAS
jgi:DNA adenine methylase